MLYEQRILVERIEKAMTALRDLSSAVSEGGVGYLGSTGAMRACCKIGDGLDSMLRLLLLDEKQRLDRMEREKE